MKTLALVIGNNDYFEGSELKCAVNDAVEIASVFRRLGYKVIEELNIKKDDCSRILTSFNDEIKNYDASIFYYAGHGFEVDGENYLIPIDCQIPPINKFYANMNSLRLSEILDVLKENSGKVNIVILDACRKSFDRGTTRTFTQVQVPQGTLIAFSTSPSSGANDGNERNGHSVYTGTLLQYIGRETLSIESLFKKVRKTVFNLTRGKQIPWEHTSLIGDFMFNTGQLVYKTEIPYKEEVIKDYLFEEEGEFGSLIMELRSCDWNRQNPALQKILSLKASDLDKNQQFVLGRNLYQVNGFAFSVQSFFENLSNSLSKYTKDGENHVLNGILYEIYFNNKGDFRTNLKKQNIEAVFSIRKNPKYRKSFEFIKNALLPYKDHLYYIPSIIDEPVDIDVNAKEMDSTLLEFDTIQIINSITINDKDILKDFSHYNNTVVSYDDFKKQLSDFLAAPFSLINIHSNIKLKEIKLNKELYY